MGTLQEINWNRQHVNLGEIKVGHKHSIEYLYKSNKKIVDIKTSCGCNKAKYDYNNKTIIVTYNPNSIPKHLQSKGYYITTKKILVSFNDKTNDILSFSAKIIQ